MKPKFLVTTLLLSIIWIIFRWQLLIAHNLVSSVFFCLIGYMVTIFRSLEVRHYTRWNLIKIFGSISIILILISSIFNGRSWLVALAIMLINGAFRCLTRYTWFEVTNKITINSYSICNTAWFIFTALATLGIICFSLWLYAEFSLTCSLLYTYYNGFLTTLTRPFVFWREYFISICLVIIVVIGLWVVIRNRTSKKSSKLKKIWLGVLIMVVWLFWLLYTAVLNQHDIGDLTFITVNADRIKQWREQVDTEFNIPLKQRLGIEQELLPVLSGDVLTSWLLTWWVLTGSIISETNKPLGIDYYKKILIDQVISDNKKANQTICDFLVGEIETRYTNPSFQFSVIALLFVLISPLARIVTIIISFIAQMLFLLLRRIQVYEIHEHNESVDELL